MSDTDLKYIEEQRLVTMNRRLSDMQQNDLLREEQRKVDLADVRHNRSSIVDLEGRMAEVERNQKPQPHPLDGLGFWGRLKWLLFGAEAKQPLNDLNSIILPQTRRRAESLRTHFTGRNEEVYSVEGSPDLSGMHEITPDEIKSILKEANS